MAISDKTRKTLWARAGNSCAMCRKELIAATNEHDKNLNIGDECHIVSQQAGGPRHDPSDNCDFDEYDNLILLCKNHHRTIDELHETFTVKMLKEMKANHEKWVHTTLENARNPASKTRLVGRVSSGKEILSIINNAEIKEFDHDELNSQEEVDLVGTFLESLGDWLDLTGMGVIQDGYLVQLAFDLNVTLKAIEEKGFLVFGERSSKRMKTSEGKDLGSFEVATIIVLRKDNPSIIDFDKIATNDTDTIQVD